MQMVSGHGMVSATPFLSFKEQQHQRSEVASQSIYAYEDMDSGSELLGNEPIDKSMDTMKEARQQRKKNKLAAANMIGNRSTMSHSQPF